MASEIDPVSDARKAAPTTPTTTPGTQTLIRGLRLLEAMTEQSRPDRKSVV